MALTPRPCSRCLDRPTLKGRALCAECIEAVYEAASQIAEQARADAARISAELAG